MSAVPVVRLDVGCRVELGAHQLPFHGLLGLAGGVQGEAVVLVVQAGQLALHPAVEFLAGELGLQELEHFLGLADLGLGGGVFGAGRLFGEHGGEQLAAELAEFAGGEVGLQQPVVGAALIARRPGRHRALVLLPGREHPEDLGADACRV